MADVQIINAKVKLDCDHLLGSFLDKSHYDFLADADIDYYAPTNHLHPENDESTCLFKLRKNVFPQLYMDRAYEGLIGAAGSSQNRGLAAGPRNEKLQQRDWVTDFQFAVMAAAVDTSVRLDGSDALHEVILNRDSKQYNGTPSRGLVWLRSEITKSGESYEDFFERWLARIQSLAPMVRHVEARKLLDNFISDTTYANPVNSGIAGFFDRYPRIPYGRATSYTEANPDKFAKSFQYLSALDTCFKQLMPQRYTNQRNACNRLDQRFVIHNTVFTTLTVNKTFRTAAHRDAGDLEVGFSNLGVINAPGKDYKGGYLVLPEYRVAINIRPGDLLLIANHDAIHGNTEITGDNIERMSIVAYFREKMLECGSYEYENYRKMFVDARRQTPNHPDSNGPLWNGISAGMWDTAEWVDWLSKQDKGDALVKKYHATGAAETSLDGFFQ